MDFYQGKSCYYQNLITVAPVIRFVKVAWIWGNDISTSWGRVPNRTLWIRFTCLPNLMFLASLWLETGDIQMFKLVIFLTLKIDSHFTTFDFYWLWAGHTYFTEFGQDVTPQKTIKTSDKKNQEPSIGSGTRHFE